VVVGGTGHLKPVAEQQAEGLLPPVGLGVVVGFLAGAEGDEVVHPPPPGSSWRCLDQVRPGQALQHRRTSLTGSPASTAAALRLSGNGRVKRHAIRDDGATGTPACAPLSACLQTLGHGIGHVQVTEVD